VRPLSYTSRRTLLNQFVGRFVAASLGLALPSLALRKAAADWSAPDPVQPATALDGDTLKLATGTEVRLIGIEAPKPNLAPGDAAMASLAAAAATSLGALAKNGVRLRYDVLRQDRYGRHLAQVFTPDGTWLQAAQIAAGLARVHGDGGNRLGLNELIVGEDEARKAERGVWLHRTFAVRRADEPGLKRLAGSFQIVAGRVVAAAIVGNTGYVNFGADRRSDFTLVIRKPVLAMLDPAVVDLSRLAGRSIRCRGWIDIHDGPSMDLTCPEQIEVLED
jgi:micrococcal nuclease